VGHGIVAANPILPGQPGRHVVIVFTDGHDSAGKSVFSGLWRSVEKSGAQIYAIGLGAAMRNYSQRMAGSGVQFLERITRITQGRYLFATRTDELSDIFDIIAAEVRAAPRYTVELSLSEATGKLQVESTGERIPASAPPRFELILDASGSMRTPVSDRRTRMQAAKQALKDVINEVPPEVEVALRTFGHRVREGDDGDCQDTELLVPFAKRQNEQLKQSIDRVVALGTTPIAYTLQQAVNDLAKVEQDGLIILVTDGEEECHPDLEAAVEELKSIGINFRLNVIGFDIGDDTINSTLRRVAVSAGGVFVKSDDAEALRGALRQTLSPQFSVADQGGNVIASGFVDQDAIELPVGNYSLRIDSTAELIDIGTIEINRGETTLLLLSKAGTSVAVSSARE
jgi:Mg-chelatase subunit ChlD